MKQRRSKDLPTPVCRARHRQASESKKEGDAAVVEEVFEPGKALVDAIVLEYLLRERVLSEGVLGHFEVFEKHHFSSCSFCSFASFWSSCPT